jgi:hypothetical protein
MTRFNINSSTINRKRNQTHHDALATKFQDELDKAMNLRITGETMEKIHLLPQRSTNVSVLVEASR